MSKPAQNMQPIRVWLFAIALLVALMVVVGGATRLTDSGLSITEWQPLLGAIPPLTDAEWRAAFAKYQLIPEYQIQNRGMSLDDFKFIYWWEWAHRLLGRIIGLAFALPLAWFLARGRIPQNLWPRLFLIFCLGGVQGALGWYMVSSGLSERTDVSQYRLSAHLTLAFAIFASVVWVALTLSTVARRPPSAGLGLAVTLIGLLFLQVVAGGFVAGLDAGHASYTWPRMNEAWWPDGMNTLLPLWRNAFENALAAQFNHRILAYLIVACALYQAWKISMPSSNYLAVAVVAQLLLGILTVLLRVPLAVALLHQFGALCVLALAVWHLSVLTRAPAPDRR